MEEKGTYEEEKGVAGKGRGIMRSIRGRDRRRPSRLRKGYV
jgi:hypothetical protein